MARGEPQALHHRRTRRAKARGWGEAAVLERAGGARDLRGAARETGGPFPPAPRDLALPWALPTQPEQPNCRCTVSSSSQNLCGGRHTWPVHEPEEFSPRVQGDLAPVPQWAPQGEGTWLRGPDHPPRRAGEGISPGWAQAWGCPRCVMEAPRHATQEGREVAGDAARRTPHSVPAPLCPFRLGFRDTSGSAVACSACPTFRG